MRIVIFGATGSTGRELVRFGVAQGHSVTAFVRPRSSLNIRHPSLTVIQGYLLNIFDVSQAVAGQDAVLSTLGNPSPMNRNPELVMGIRYIVQAMHQAETRRLVYLSFLGAGEGRQQLGGLLRYIAPLMLRNDIADHEEREAIIRSSDLDWTIVRPPKLTNGPWTAVYRHGPAINTRGIVPTISRADVADFMLRQVSDQTYLRQATAVMR